MSPRIFRCAAAQARWSLDVIERARKYADASSMRLASVLENSKAMRAVNARLITSRSCERNSVFNHGGANAQACGRLRLPNGSRPGIADVVLVLRRDQRRVRTDA